MEIKVGNVYRVKGNEGEIIHFFNAGTVVKCIDMYNNEKEELLVECRGMNASNEHIILQTLNICDLEDLEEDREEVIV